MRTWRTTEPRVPILYVTGTSVLQLDCRTEIQAEHSCCGNALPMVPLRADCSFSRVCMVGERIPVDPPTFGSGRVGLKRGLWVVQGRHAHLLWWPAARRKNLNGWSGCRGRRERRSLALTGSWRVAATTNDPTRTEPGRRFGSPRQSRKR